MKILFVCTGNTCRSSMARVIAEKWLKENLPGRTDVIVDSAGLAACPGASASPQAVKVMQAVGNDLTGHCAKQLNAELMQESSLVLTMTRSHKNTLLNLFPRQSEKVFTLAEFACGQDVDISDPFAQPVEVYQDCARELTKYIQLTLQRLTEKGGQNN